MIDINFKRYEGNPILRPNPDIPYQVSQVFNPSAVVREGKVFLIYRAEDKKGISRLCLASSEDGFDFELYSGNPVLEPTGPKEEKGCEDPRITEIDGVYYLTYTAFAGTDESGKAEIYLNLAESSDLKNWKKHGTIISGMKSGYILPQRINGEYLMIIGEGDVHIARSQDLISWTLDPEPFLKPRPGHFDSHLVEVGPPLIPTGDKFLMIYNSADDNKVYSPSYVILSKDNPAEVVYRHDKPLLLPEKDYEKKGKEDDVIFAEGLVNFEGKYFLYYGGADRYIGLAIGSIKNPAEK